MRNIRQTGLDNIFTLSMNGSKILSTKSLVPGVHSEKTITVGDEEFRIWDPYHSKLAAIILKGSSISIKKDSTVLYLGAANGTTVSHVSDIVLEGTVFAVEFSPRAMKDLIRISIPRTNLIPILADARYPDSYRNMVSEVDFIYQDVAQREQAGIAIRNASLFLKKNGLLILMIKLKSIDSIKKTDEVAKSEIKRLEDHFNIKELIDLEPFHSDHTAVIAQKR
ncbi:fibrillarin-like rRNA methylase [Candidatus Methanoperedens nitroreducens]|uniref:Fibrillarin-like rRNA/tRNA 2'-O-methyltransferase n=1 Tax=Candidatus Methanoperedens nitratireducens TaxID=1392998 RepID=A0A062V9H2_9EURY|nr:fibrillarin-like rRNA/tRNA 2'-O-methyltransferase [Candidatus Methanoperedens nitroreducens]KCZ71995.1 fibrillarin-like rRNA methylase [Candidatus Methanoperedens nitroreducens]MDJ1422029.1 fibrillarin-like rRNA/tRNA 2'-O-methyltransferase [Candidatus Methanoperedens sp.]